MNEVNIPKAAQFNAVNASSKGAVEAQPQGGKSLPDQSVNESTTEKPQASNVVNFSLESEVEKVNEFVQSIQRDLQFTVDKELERTVIKVTDSESGEIIRQIPEDIFLELARRLKENGELQLVRVQG